MFLYHHRRQYRDKENIRVSSSLQIACYEDTFTKIVISLVQ